MIIALCTRQIKGLKITDYQLFGLFAYLILNWFSVKMPMKKFRFLKGEK